MLMASFTSPKTIIVICLSSIAALFLLGMFDKLHANQTQKIFDASKNRWVETSINQLSDDRSKNIEQGRKIVQYPNTYKTGTIIIDTSARQLFRILDKDQALRYAIGVGREGYAWKGREKITRKAEWPTWTPPREMRAREAKNGRILPTSVEGGLDNPMGARALYLGSTLYRIHGTNQPWSVGAADSSGCIRMTNDDVIHLFEQTVIGTLVIVQ